jgi:hypothetical protein
MPRHFLTTCRPALLPLGRQIRKELAKGNETTMKKYQKPNLKSLGLLRSVTKFSDINWNHRYWFF